MDITPSQKIASTGSYAFAEVNKLVDQLKEKGISPIDFGVGDPSSPVPDFVIEAGYAGMQKHATTGYPSYIGMPSFRQAAADYMQRRFGVALDPETEISSNIGSKEAIFNLPLGLIDPGDLVIIASPGYPPFSTGTRFAGGEPYFVGLFPENDFMIDYEAIPEDVAKRAKMMWLNYPNSPTGKAASLDWYRGLIDWAQKHEIILAADEGCYIDMYFDESEPPHSILELARDGIITFYSMSKRNNMTGWRTGFVAGDARLIDIYKKVKTNVDSGTPSFVQEGAIAAMNDDSHVAAMRDEYREKKDIMLSALADAGLPAPSIDATFYIWQRAPEGVSGVELAKKLLADDIAVVTTPGEWISQADSGDGRNPGADFIRFALVPSVVDVQAAADRIRQHLKF